MPDDRSFVWPAGGIIQVTGAARRPSWAHFAWRVLADSRTAAADDASYQRHAGPVSRHGCL